MGVGTGGGGGAISSLRCSPEARFWDGGILSLFTPPCHCPLTQDFCPHQQPQLARSDGRPPHPPWAADHLPCTWLWRLTAQLLASLGPSQTFFPGLALALGPAFQGRVSLDAQLCSSSQAPSSALPQPWLLGSGPNPTYCLLHPQIISRLESSASVMPLPTHPLQHPPGIPSTSPRHPSPFFEELPGALRRKPTSSAQPPAPRDLPCLSSRPFPLFRGHRGRRGADVASSEVPRHSL